MDEPVISSFDTRYYSRALCGAITFLWATGYMLWHCLAGDLVQPRTYMLTLLLCAVDWIYYYFFSKSWKRFTVTATAIIVEDVVFRKRLTIPFADISRVGVYRAAGGRALPLSFVIEFNGDRSVGFREAWYNNYSKLTMAIYYHKYGPGHGRERYMERHSHRV